MRSRLVRFMAGRYGAYVFGFDTLTKWTFIAAGVLIVVQMFLPFRLAAHIISIVAFVLTAWQVFRFLSRNIAARQHENMRFVRFLDNVSMFFGGKTEGDKKIYRCSKCRTKVRVPKGKGKIRITCPKCGAQFIKKT